MCFVVIKYSKKQKLYSITWTSMLLSYVCAGVWFCRLSTLCYAYETWVFTREDKYDCEISGHFQVTLQ